MGLRVLVKNILAAQWLEDKSDIEMVKGDQEDAFVCEWGEKLIKLCLRFAVQTKHPFLNVHNLCVSVFIN